MAKNNKKTDEISFYDVAKKALQVGMGAIFLTEENIKNIVSDINLPKEKVSNLLKQAKESKDEIGKKIANEITGILSRIDFKKEVREILKGVTVELNTKVKFNVNEKKDTND